MSKDADSREDAAKLPRGESIVKEMPLFELGMCKQRVENEVGEARVYVAGQSLELIRKH